MKLPYAGLDGVKRMLARMRYEGSLWWSLCKGNVWRWVRRPWDSHAFVDVFVESIRTEDIEYFLGHIWAWQTVLMIIWLIL